MLIDRLFLISALSCFSIVNSYIFQQTRSVFYQNTFHSLIVAKRPYYHVFSHIYDDSETRESIKRSNNIDKLVRKLINLITVIFPSRNITEDKNPTYEPIIMRIQSEYTHPIEFNHSFYARKYFSLPISSYSILDSSIIRRRSDIPNTFTLKLPLGTFSSSYQTVSGNIMNLPKEASVDIEVISIPENNTILMSSKDIFFFYEHLSREHSLTPNQNISTFDKTKDRISPPPWLVWNGNESENRYKNNNENENASNSLFINQSTNNIIIRSSIQSKFDMKINWPVEPSNSEKIKQSNFFSTIQRYFYDNNSPSSSPSSSIIATDDEKINIMNEIKEENTKLIVKAQVKVVVDVNMPFRSSIAGIINFGPIKILLVQIGTLLVDSIIRIVSSGLTRRLLLNYESRKKKWIEADQQIVIDNVIF